MFEAAGDSSSCRIGFARGIPEVCERKRGIPGVVLQEVLGEVQVVLAEKGRGRGTSAHPEAQRSGPSGAAPGPAGLTQLGVRSAGVGAQHSIPQWQCLGGQDLGMGRTPGRTGHQDRHTLSAVVASPGPGLSLTPRLAP